jgi:hypothetical protein
MSEGRFTPQRGLAWFGRFRDQVEQFTQFADRAVG